jgi:hypothetical protein
LLSGVTLPSMKVVTLTPGLLIVVNVVPSLERSMRYPVACGTPPVHESFIWFDAMPANARLVTELRRVCAFTVAATPSPTLLVGVTRNR